jgi:HK97 family phage major capsid protein
MSKTLLDLAREKRAELMAPADQLIQKAETEGRNLDEAEFAQVRSIAKSDEVVALDERIADLVDLAARNAVAATPVPRVGVKSEPRTYAPEVDPQGRQFLSDFIAGELGRNHEARARLDRHMVEERTERRSYFENRAAATTAFAGLVVPQYLTDLVAKSAAAARPFADICNKHQLPAAGTTVNISRVTTATSAAAQSENSAASETNIDDTLLTETMFTVAGQQTLSRQAIDRGIGTEEITLDDLIRRYHSALDAKLINDGTTGLTNVAQSVAYTDASPTAAELYPKILNAQANLEAVMLDQGVGDLYAVMHSRRWAWMQSQVGTSWPFIGQPGYAVQAGGQNLATGYGMGVRGILPNGIKVIVDNNIATNLGAGTNEDEIYVVNASELHLWEDSAAPLFIRADQTAAASLGVLLVVYGYAAYSFRRYTNGHQKIAGTGLVTPTF